MTSKVLKKLSCFLMFSAMLAGMMTNVGVADEPVSVRFLSYNIHHGEGIDKKLDLERIAKVIQSVNPDLVALQEVDKNAPRTNSVDQAAELARLTRMHAVFGGNIPLGGGEYGNALLSRHPIVSHKNHKLPNIDRSEQRGVIEAEVQFPGLPEPLLVLATHLDYRSDNRERLESVEFINSLVTKSPQKRALLAGDFNDVPGSRTLKLLNSTWHQTNQEAAPTFPVGTPTRQIDFIFCRPSKGWKVKEFKVLEEAVASDHRAVFSVLEAVTGSAD